MTDDEEKPEENGGEKSTPAPQGADFKQIVRVLALTAGVAAAAIFLVFLFSQLFLPFVVLFEGGEVHYSVVCYKDDDRIMKDQWLLSDNITSYEDIPESGKANLSNDTVERLNDFNSYSFNATRFSDLPEEQKDIFREGIDDSARVDRDNDFPQNVLYKGNLYFCDTDPISPGA